MKPFFQNRWLFLSIRFLLGAVFIYSGWVKVLNPQAFADSIATFQLLPKELINVLALTLPPFELILGILTVIGQKMRVTSFSILTLTGIFMLALMQALIRDLNIDCGCFGSNLHPTRSLWIPIGRDLLFLIGAAWLYCDVRKADQE